MDTETLAAAGAGAAILVSSAVSTWQAIQAKREAREAKGHSQTAADNSKPVSNGFTAEVRKGLSDIFLMATEARDMATSANTHAEAASGKIDRHLEAHANAGLQVLPGGRAAQ